MRSTTIQQLSPPQLSGRSLPEPQSFSIPEGKNRLPSPASVPQNSASISPGQTESISSCPTIGPVPQPDFNTVLKARLLLYSGFSPYLIGSNHFKPSSYPSSVGSLFDPFLGYSTKSSEFFSQSNFNLSPSTSSRLDSSFLLQSQLEKIRADQDNRAATSYLPLLCLRGLQENIKDKF